jgi:L-lactate dehydrogenase complex protein LldG
MKPEPARSERSAVAPQRRPGREEIMARLRAACRGAVAAPPPEEIPPATLGWADFRAALEEADGVVHAPVAVADLAATLERVAGGGFLCAQRAAALLGRAPAPVQPQDLEGTGWLVATGTLAVARTGSILVTQEDAPVRAHLLFPETLVLLVPEGALVGDLPDLYRRLDPRTLAGGYLTLVSGPSRTADIEQTLVTGAHGPRRLVVVPIAGQSAWT